MNKPQNLLPLYKALSIQNAAWGTSAVRIMSAAIQAVDPSSAVRRYMRREEDQLYVDGNLYELSKLRRIRLIGAGKAGYPMVRAAAEILYPHLEQARVIVKEGHGPADKVDAREPGGTAVGGKDQPFNNLVVFEASHPIPDEKGILATSRLIELISDSQPDDLIIFLVSGGGSALLVSPVRGISLGDIQELTSLLLSSGATINEINALRKHLSKVKGGGLARFAAPAQVATLILSDVVGDPLDVIASGPTVPDSTTYEDAWEVLEKYDIVGITPSEITDHLKRGLSGELPETPKPGDPIFERVQNVVIGSNMLACQSAVRQATEEGFNSLILTTWLEGEASQAGGFLAAVLQQIASSGHPVPRPACIVVGGETTVTIQGGGLGGRNQEIALSAVSELESLQDVALITLATDGGDGPTDAAGAVATGNTLQRARSMGLDPEDYLNRNDSYHFFDQLDDLIRTGPTLTNVNDIAILIADHPERVVPS